MCITYDKDYLLVKTFSISHFRYFIEMKISIAIICVLKDCTQPNKSSKWNLGIKLIALIKGLR